MADSTQKPEPLPSAVEPDEEEEEPRSNLSPDAADREAQKAIREIEEEIEEEHPSKKPHPHHATHTGPQKSFVDKAWDAQDKVEANLSRFGHGRYSRVIKMARKPEPEEYSKALQITGLGIVVIGFVGFLIYLLMQWVTGLMNVK